MAGFITQTMNLFKLGAEFDFGDIRRGASLSGPIHFIYIFYLHLEVRP